MLTPSGAGMDAKTLGPPSIYDWPGPQGASLTAVAILRQATEQPLEHTMESPGHFTRERVPTVTRVAGARVDSRRPHRQRSGDG